ncbi:MAG TPA: cytochrome P450 [Acidimicrobiales bacterium]|nr:cytochrome P450 [Acidimicrobiales bacterium]
MQSDDIGLVDPASPEYWHDIHGALAPLREQWPVVRSTAGDFEVLRYEHVQPLLRDARLTQAVKRMLTNQGITSGPLHEWFELIMTAMDPPDHTRLRSLVGRALTPRQVERVRADIVEITNALLDRIAREGADDVEVLDGICNELPLAVLCRLLGISDEDRAIVEQWTVTVGLSFTAQIPADLLPRIEQAITDFDAYSSAMIDRRRANPGDDLFTALVQAEESGDRLSRVELQALVINLLFAGHDTTRSMLAICLWLLATHPDQTAFLREDPDRIPVAVEEMVRYEPIISGIPRIPTVDLDIAGVRVPAGSYVTLSVPSANRDPRAFSAPDRLDVLRPDAHRHLGFGLGAHFCVGANVARAELREAVRIVLERCRVIEARTEPVWQPYAASRRFESLSMRFEVGPRRS